MPNGQSSNVNIRPLLPRRLVLLLLAFWSVSCFPASHTGWGQKKNMRWGVMETMSPSQPFLQQPGHRGRGAQPARQLVWGLEPRVASQRHHHTTHAEKQHSVTDSRSCRVSLGCQSCLPASRQLPDALPDVLNVVRQCLGTAASNSQVFQVLLEVSGQRYRKGGNGEWSPGWKQWYC